MNGSDIQVSAATRVQDAVAARWTTAADRLLEVAPQRLEPALAPIVADLVIFCRAVAGRVRAGKDAAYILQHNFGPLAWNNALCAGGFDQVLRTTAGMRTPYQMRQLLVEVMNGQPFHPCQPTAILDHDLP